MERSAIDDAVRDGDLDELLRLVDACCADRDWDALEALHASCERAHESGRQLWPAASHAAYRLALEAPATYAAAMLVDGAGRFAVGPLSEVAAQAHSWHDLATRAPEGATAVLAAHERVVRGEDVSDLPPAGPTVLELPWRLAPWEPAYAIAEYHAHRAEFPAPAEVSGLVAIELPGAPQPEPSDDVTAALLDTTRVWTTESNGRAAAIVVHGSAMHAIAALGPPAARAVEVAPAEALAHVAWAGASGGAHGRRRGAAAGRFSAWWLGGALADALDDWPVDEARLDDAIARCRWYAWDAAEHSSAGWQLHLAIDDPTSGRAWALAATDTTRMDAGARQVDS